MWFIFVHAHKLMIYVSKTSTSHILVRIDICLTLIKIFLPYMTKAKYNYTHKIHTYFSKMKSVEIR